MCIYVTDQGILKRQSMNNVTVDAIHTLYSTCVKILPYLITDEELISH